MLDAEIKSIANAKAIRPHDRLRLMIEAARHHLKVDSISAYLHSDHVPFARSIIQAREQLPIPKVRQGVSSDPQEYASSTYRWWPFYFSGMWDRTTLFATLEPFRLIEPFPLSTLYDARSKMSKNRWTNHSHSDDWQRLKLEGSEPYLFSSREKIRDWTWFKRPGTKSSLLIFYNWRSDAPNNDLRRLQDFACLMQDVASEITVPEDASVGFDHVTASFAANARLFSKSIADASKPDERGRRILAFLNWLVHDVGRLLGAPDLRIRAYCCTERNGDRDRVKPRALFADDDHGLDRELSLCAISGLSMYSRPRPQDGRKFSRLDELLKVTKSWKQDSKNQPVGEPNWTTRQSGSLVVPDPCGLVTYAAHAGMTVYLEDVNRRFCSHAPIYGAAYTTLDPLVRFNFVVPLLCPPIDTEKCSSWSSIGVVSFESRRIQALKSAEAAYIAALLALAAKCLPAEADGAELIRGEGH